MNTLVFYVPTNATEEQEKLDFCNELQGVLEKLPWRDVMGDANAQVGGCNVGYEDVISRFEDGTMTEDGEMFSNMCSLTSLIIVRSMFYK